MHRGWPLFGVEIFFGTHHAVVMSGCFDDGPHQLRDEFCCTVRVTHQSVVCFHSAICRALNWVAIELSGVNRPSVSTMSQSKS